MQKESRGQRKKQQQKNIYLNCFILLFYQILLLRFLYPQIFGLTVAKMKTPETNKE